MNFITHSSNNWSAQSAPVNRHSYSVDFVTSDTGTIVGQSGMILRTENGGNTWSEQPVNHNHQLLSVSFVNASIGIAGGEQPLWRVPKTAELKQNYPNPFNPVTTIEYSIQRKQLVSLRIYDLMGREGTTLVEDVKSPGTYRVQWDAGNLSSGIYIYRLVTGSTTLNKKVVLLK